MHTPDDQFEENTETVRLIDGHRGVEMPVCYMKRAKITAGEYLIFYRVAFRHEPKQQKGGGSGSSPLRTGGNSKLASPGSAISGKAPASNNMDDATDYAIDNSDFFHEQRKIVLSVHFPAQSKLQMQRIETEPTYGKDIFVRMRRHYKQKFEQGVQIDDVIHL